MRKIAEDGAGLAVKVAHHFIGAPSAEKADDVSVNTGTKQGVGTGSSETAGGDIVGSKAKGGAPGGYGITKSTSEE